MTPYEAALAAKVKFERAKAEYEESVKVAFAEGMDPIFQRHPVLASFSWTQYTPYFNDGDECVFQASVDYPNILFVGDPEPEDDEEYEENEFSRYEADRKRRNGETLTEKEVAGLEVLDFLQAIDEGQFKKMFGDHCRVTVRRSEVEVTEYEHD